MKRVSFLLLISFLFTMNAQANNLNTIRNSIDQIDQTVTSNARKIRRRQNLANDINNILLEAQSLIDQRLNQNTSGPSGRVDMQLVRVALQSCSNLNTYPGRANCFRGYLQDSRGILIDIKNGCDAVSSSENSSNCYIKSLSALSGRRTPLEVIATAGCKTLNTYPDRTKCYSNMLKNSHEDGIVVLSSSCKAVSSSENSSNCFTKSLAVSDLNLNIVEVLLNGCKNLNTYPDRNKCYTAGVNKAENIGMNIKRYVRGCFTTASSQQASNCFTNSLNAL